MEKLKEINLHGSKVAIIGLGYVGLPLAVEFAKKYQVIGFDINTNRVTQLNENYDNTLEIAPEQLNSVLIKESELSANKCGLYCTGEQLFLNQVNVFIVTVPTPVDKHKRPNLTPLYKASETVGKSLKKGDVVIYESTVYPGVTEDECVPVLEKISGLVYNVDFFAGYSPERINPGDKEHTVTKILKVTSGSTPEIAEFVDNLYKSIIVAGTHKAPSIKVAEASKVIENSQRDINIAFVNELSKIFKRLDIDTTDVLNAAATKWNFLHFKPGLVGGHCIGVDPYYLAQKAQELGYHPEILLAGRRLNDSMGAHVAEEVIKLMVKKKVSVLNARCLILGFTFKENCPDVRNTRVIDIINELKAYHIEPIVYDPWANPADVKEIYDITICNELPQGLFNAVILAVAHKVFLDLDINILKDTPGIVFDVKSILPKNIIDGRL